MRLYILGERSFKNVEYFTTRYTRESFASGKTSDKGICILLFKM